MYVALHTPVSKYPIMWQINERKETSSWNNLYTSIDCICLYREASTSYCLSTVNPQQYDTMRVGAVAAYLARAKVAIESNPD
jgi:hypothetical protein